MWGLYTAWEMLHAYGCPSGRVHTTSSSGGARRFAPSEVEAEREMVIARGY